jgi:hypothetical protein
MDDATFIPGLVPNNGNMRAAMNAAARQDTRKEKITQIASRDVIPVLLSFACAADSIAVMLRPLSPHNYEKVESNRRVFGVRILVFLLDRFVGSQHRRSLHRHSRDIRRDVRQITLAGVAADD